MYLYCCYIDRDDEEDLEPEAHGPANTSTSNTLVLSEDRRVAPETSPPAHVDPEASSLAPIPRAPKKKRARTGAAGKQELAAGSISTPLLDDVSYFFLLVVFFVYSNNFLLLGTIFLSCRLFAALDEGVGQLRLPFYQVPRRGRNFKR